MDDNWIVVNIEVICITYDNVIRNYVLGFEPYNI